MDSEKAKAVVEAAIEKGLAKAAEPVIPTAVAVVPEAPAEQAKEVQLVAETPAEMVSSQFSLIEWAKRKIRSLEDDFLELNASYESAVAQKWKSSTLKRHRDKAGAEITYYKKMLAAFEAGYILVPNMPGALFVVRTDEVCPDGRWKYFHADARNQPSSQLPIGEGGHVAAKNETYTMDITNPEGRVLESKTRAIRFGEIEMPFALAKPRIMEATSRAMALRIFDEFMILPADVAPAPSARRVTRQDPIVLGVITCHKRTTFAPKSVSFMIAWHIDTRAL